jgi:hypothetical protein
LDIHSGHQQATQNLLREATASQETSLLLRCQRDLCRTRKKNSFPVSVFRIHVVNCQLNLFLFQPQVNNKDRIRGSTITLLGYPRRRGFVLWEERIVDTVKSLLAAEGKETALLSASEDFTVGPLSDDDFGYNSDEGSVSSDSGP